MAHESRSACEVHAGSLVLGMLSKSDTVEVVSDRTKKCGYRLWVDRGDLCGRRSALSATPGTWRV